MQNLSKTRNFDLSQFSAQVKTNRKKLPKIESVEAQKHRTKLSSKFFRTCQIKSRNYVAQVLSRSVEEPFQLPRKCHCLNYRFHPDSVAQSTKSILSNNSSEKNLWSLVVKNIAQ